MVQERSRKERPEEKHVTFWGLKLLKWEFSRPKPEPTTSVGAISFFLIASFPTNMIQLSKYAHGLSRHQA